MLKEKEILSSLLLFVISIGWGHLWTTEILACPEWWFLSVNALLLGAGIALVRFFPEEWRTTAPALLLSVILLLSPSDLKSVLLPLCFGFWYGGNAPISKVWRISRLFCGGLMIGGILAGILPSNDLLIPSLTILLLIYGGLQQSRLAALEMGLYCIFYMWCFTPAPPQENSNWIDTGTVISGFGLVPDDQEQPARFPKIVFVGGLNEDHVACSQELAMVSDLLFLPELPGAVPHGCDMIVVCGLSESSSGGAASLLRALRRDGVLIMPLQYCPLLPNENWHILPGSDGSFAVCSPGRDLQLDPVQMDQQIARHFTKSPSHAPLQGALSGMLLDFEDRKFEIPAPSRKNIFRVLTSGAAALSILCALWMLRVKRRGAENFRIILNCAGYTMMTALLIPLILRSMPFIFSINSIVTPAINSLVIISAVMWLFRRPVTHDFRNRLIGLISLLALAGAWFGSWLAAMIAHTAGGFAFSGLDGDLCGKRDNEVEPVRFLGIAVGAFAAAVLQQFSWYIPILFITVAAMRLWSWFRN